MEKKLLIVDDEEVIRNLFEEVFSGAGYIPRTAGNAEEALEILKRESIMVMYLDLRLPKMSGTELCEQIRSKNPLAIIHAITGYTDLFSLWQCRVAGFDDFIEKPIAVDLLLRSAEVAFEKVERWKVDEYELI